MKDLTEDNVFNDDCEDYLTEEQKASIERGLKDVEEGRVTAHEIVRAKYGL